MINLVIDALKRYLAGERFTHFDLRPMISRLLESHEETKEQLAELEQEYDELFNRKAYIPWIKYDPHSRAIESHVTCLVTDGETVRLAQHAKLLDRTGYGWYENNGGYRWNGVTHWSPINLPGEETK